MTPPESVLAAQLGAQVRRIRQRLGWTQVRLSEATGIARPNISALEAGTRPPKLGTLVTVARGLRCSLAELLRPLEAHAVHVDRESAAEPEPWTLAGLAAELEAQERSAEVAVPVGVLISNKGCREAYGAPCPCPPGKCWVTYARAAHDAGSPALTAREWDRRGQPMPTAPVVTKSPWRKQRFAARRGT